MPTTPAAAESFDALNEELAAFYVVTDGNGEEIGRFGPVGLVPNAEALAVALESQHEDADIHVDWDDPRSAYGTTPPDGGSIFAVIAPSGREIGRFGPLALVPKAIEQAVDLMMTCPRSRIVHINGNA